MTLTDYYTKFKSMMNCPHFLDVDEISSLQHELISKLSEKDRNDFFAYLKRPLGIKNGKVFPRPRKTEPRIWKFIHSSLPLYLLFTYPGDSRLERLYNKYKKGDYSVLKRIEDFK